MGRQTQGKARTKWTVLSEPRLIVLGRLAHREKSKFEQGGLIGKNMEQTQCK